MPPFKRRIKQTIQNTTMVNEVIKEFIHTSRHGMNSERCKSQHKHAWSSSGKQRGEWRTALERREAETTRVESLIKNQNTTQLKRILKCDETPDEEVIQTAQSGLVWMKEERALCV